MIELHDTTDSTNDLALEAASAGAPHGACWVADRQTAGRGRREIGGARRDWFSPAHSNIYMSVLLRPDVPPEAASRLTLAAGVGIADALVDQTDTDIWLKWPNDLYVGDRKLAGILTEASIDHGELAGIVVGFGINVNVPADRVPDKLADVMTSLLIETGERWDRMSLVFEVRDRLLERCVTFEQEGIGGMLDDLRDYDRTPGRAVEIQQDKEWVEGTSRGIGEEGQLVVEVDGETVDVQAGEVRFVDL